MWPPPSSPSEAGPVSFPVHQFLRLTDFHQLLQIIHLSTQTEVTGIGSTQSLAHFRITHNQRSNVQLELTCCERHQYIIESEVETKPGRHKLIPGFHSIGVIERCQAVFIQETVLGRQAEVFGNERREIRWEYTVRDFVAILQL